MLACCMTATIAGRGRERKHCKKTLIKFVQRAAEKEGRAQNKCLPIEFSRSAGVESALAFTYDVLDIKIYRSVVCVCVCTDDSLPHGARMQSLS